MIDLIKELLNPGDSVVVYLTGEIEPIRANFVKVADNALLLRDANGYCIVKADLIVKCLVPEIPAVETQPAPALQPIEDCAVAEEPEKIVVTAEAEEDTPAEAEENDANDSFSPIFTPKVVGRIDLDAIVDPRRKRPYSAVRPSDENPMVPAGGTISSIGPAFGFILASNGESLFFSRGEVMQRNRGDEVHKGMPVVFTPGHNAKGGVARCVHVQMTVQEQLEWIEKIEQYDQRNARMMAEQLLLAFPDDAQLADTLSPFEIRPRRNDHSKIGVPVAEKTLAAVAHGYYVEPADLLRAEKEIAVTKPYEEAFELISKLLDFAMTNSRQQCYQLFVRLVKLARNQGDQERTFATLDRAIEFYADEAGARAYFEGLRRKAAASADEVPASSGIVDAAFDKIMSSIKTNVGIYGEDTDRLNQALNDIHSKLSPLNEAVCGQMDVAEMQKDSIFERRFFYEVLSSLSKAVADKFDTEFELPDAERFIGEGVSEFAAMAELTAAIKSLRAMLADRPDASRRKLHIVCLVKNFGEIIGMIASGELSENFMRHYKAVAETPGVSLQMVAASTESLTAFMEQKSNKGVDKTFTIYSLGESVLPVTETVEVEAVAEPEPEVEAEPEPEAEAAAEE